MIRSTLDVIQLPDKDLYKVIQSNAKFKSLKDVLKTKVGINNFYNIMLSIKSSIFMRDILLNSQYVSAWARSSQVLNSTDSKFSVYVPFDSSYDVAWNKVHNDLIAYEYDGYSMDNMRTLLPLYLMTDYNISINLMSLVYLYITLSNGIKANAFYVEEAKVFVAFLLDIFKKYELADDLAELESYFIKDIESQFQSYDVIAADKLCKLTDLENYEFKATYSVVGQVFRHRTIYKCFKYNTSKEFLIFMECTKNNTQEYLSTDKFEVIGVPTNIAYNINAITHAANSPYEFCQGSILDVVINGTPASIYKTLSQRTCFINDTLHFSDAFIEFERRHPTKKLIPPCKANCSGNGCYVEYVNISRMKGEEKTQIPCPIWYTAQLQKNIDGFNAEQLANIDSNKKTKWYYNNIKTWSNWKKHNE